MLSSTYESIQERHFCNWVDSADKLIRRTSHGLNPWIVIHPGPGAFSKPQ